MYLIADRLTATGFKMGGLKKVYVADKDTAAKTLQEISEEARILLITNTLAGHVKRDVEKLRKAGKIIVEIPDKSGIGENFVDKMIKDVIGIELKK